MGCKKGDEVNGHSLNKEPDTADLPAKPLSRRVASKMSARVAKVATKWRALGGHDPCGYGVALLGFVE